jgi:hypothetical protein
MRGRYSDDDSEGIDDSIPNYDRKKIAGVVGLIIKVSVLVLGEIKMI